MRTKRILVSVLTLLFLVCAIAWWWNHDSDRRWGCFRNEDAFCWNCSHFFRNAIEQYSVEHSGWYPQGGKTALDSLTRLLAYDDHVTAYTCHALAGKLSEYYKKTGSFSEEFCCYRYNEGLRSEDPEDLIVLYYYKPTHWESQSKKGSILGRQVLTTSGMGWNFIPEVEFQRRQRKTEAFIRERIRRKPEIDLVATNLIVAVVCTNLGTNMFRFTAEIRNRGSQAAVVCLLAEGALMHRADGSYEGYFLEKQGSEIRLKPGQIHSFPGWFELTVEDEFRNRQLVARTMLTRSYSGFKDTDSTPLTNTGKGQSWYTQGVEVGSVNSSCRVEASLRASVEMGSISQLPMVLKSQPFYYLMPHDNSATARPVQTLPR